LIGREHHRDIRSTGHYRVESLKTAWHVPQTTHE
jgi:hypothetical protein